MPIHKPRHSLLLNYDKICPICHNEFYSRNLTIKYCSKKCSSEADREWRRKYQTRYRAKIKELNKVIK